MFFESNCQALARVPQNLPLLERLKTVSPARDIDVLETPDGGISIIYQGAPLHDLKGAMSEAQTVSDQHCHPSQDSFFVMFGLGLGYLLREVVQRSSDYPQAKIVLYEPHLHLLRFVLENVDLTPYFARNQVILTHDAFTLGQLVEQLFHYKKHRMEILFLPGYLQLMQEDIVSQMQKLMRLMEGKQIGMHTGLEFNMQWIASFLRNLPDFAFSGFLEELSGCYAGRPALVVGAGPSLDREIESIRQYAERAVIIAVGRAVKPLLAAGIQPDFAVFGDYDGIADQVENLQGSLSDTALIVSPFVQNEVLKTPSRKRFLAMLEKYPHMTQWLDETLNRQSQPVDVIGSISTLAFQAAYVMGCSPIVLVGQDLAFSGTRQYASNAALHEDVKIENGAYVLACEGDYDGARIGLVELPGQNGETLLTKKDYEMVKYAFESLAELCKRQDSSRRLLNASPGGVQLDGYENISVAEALSNLESFYKAATWASLGQVSHDEALNRWQLFLQGLERLEEAVSQCAQYIDVLLPLLSGVKTEIDLNRISHRQSELFSAFRQQIKTNSLLATAISAPSCAYNDRVNPHPKHWSDQQANLTATIEFLEACRDILTRELQSVTQEVHRQMRENVPSNGPASNSVLDAFPLAVLSSETTASASIYVGTTEERSRPS